MRAEDVRAVITDMVTPTETLRLQVREGVIGDGIPLMPQLAAVELFIGTLKQARFELLRHERARGASWAEISNATGIPPSTWRNRYRRGE